MRTVNFIQNLKHSILELESNSENHILYIDTDYNLIRAIKGFTLERVNKLNLSNKNHEMQQFISDLLNRDNFAKRLKYCVIKLNEFDIPKNNQVDLIKNAIEFFLQNPNFNQYRSNEKTFNELFIAEISNCFKNWYYPEDMFFKEFAQERQLIYLNPNKKSWQISNIGSYFVKTSIFESIALLCALEIIFSSESRNNQFLTNKLLDTLLEAKQSIKLERFQRFPQSIRALGIIYDSNDCESNEIVITDFGQKVLQYVKNKIDKYKDLVLFLLESDISGFQFNNENETDVFIDLVNNSKILIVDQRESIKNALLLYKNEKYLDSLRILFPLLESILDLAIVKIGLNPPDFKGMQSKVEKLQKENFISAKISTGLEIASRNKILHGNLIDNDDETLKPLFNLIQSYFKKVLIEIEHKILTIND